MDKKEEWIRVESAKNSDAHVEPPVVIGMGTCCVDLLACVEEIPPSNGATLLEQYSSQGGGKVPTALVALACLGTENGRIGMVGRVAGDRFGQFSLYDFHHHGIDTSHVQIQEGGKTAFAIVVSENKSKSRTFLKTNGEVGRMSEQDLDLEYFRNCRFLHLEHANDIEISAAIIVHKIGGRVVFDADRYWPGMERIVPHIDVFIASEDYFKKAFPQGAMEENMRILQKQGPDMVVVTLGDKGCVVLDGADYCEVPGFNVQVVDTTGAGDVFHGAFIYGLLQNWSSKRIAQFANAVAAIKCTGVGGRAAIPTYTVTEKFIETGVIDYEGIDLRVQYYADALFQMNSN